MSPKMHLEFNIPEEREEAEQAWKGHAYAYILEQIDEFCRGIVKYDTKRTDKEVKLAQEIRDMIRDEKAQEGIKDE